MGHLRLFLFYHVDIGAILGLLKVKWDSRAIFLIILHFGILKTTLKVIYDVSVGIDGSLAHRCDLGDSAIIRR